MRTTAAPNAEIRPTGAPKTHVIPPPEDGHYAYNPEALQKIKELRTFGFAVGGKVEFSSLDGDGMKARIVGTIS